MTFDDMTPDQIRQVIADAEAALAAREAEEAARATVDDAVAAYAESQGLTVLQAWRALAPGGVEVPDDPVPEPLPDAPEWEQRYGHNAYQVGDLVTFEGKVYENIWAGNTFTPVAYPQGWRLIG